MRPRTGENTADAATYFTTTLGEGVTVESSLAWLLQPITVQTFLDDFWGTTHCHIKRACAGYFDVLLPGSSAVEDLLNSFRLEPSLVRLVRRDEKKISYRLADDSLDVVRMREGFADGYTIVLDGVERCVRPIGSMAHSIEAELNFATQVNGYLTPAESQGFTSHYDDHDVLILQIQGSKLWHLYDVELPPHEMRRREAVDPAGLPLPSDLRLEAGDVLYVPRGQVHAAEATSEPSLHMTVGIHAPTVLTLIDKALDALSFRDDRVDARLPPRHLDDADIRGTLSSLVRDVAKALEETSVVDEGLDALEEVLVRRGRCPPVGHGLSNVGGIDQQTVVKKYEPLYSRVATFAGGVALKFAQLAIKAGPDHEAAMRYLARSAAPFRIGDLPGLTASQQTELARTLLVSGFLVRLPDD